MELPRRLIRRLRSFRGAEFGKGATPREIDLAARRLGVVFPRNYRTFLELFGWASIGGLELYGLGEDVPAHLNLVEVTLSERTGMRPRMPHHLVPLANDGGNHYCLGADACEERERPVVFWDHALREGQDPALVGRSLEAWLSAELDEP
jgi:hypothetical protein